jgi:hypothetical protein
MSTIVTRSGKGSPLTHTEVDNNFTNLNTDKLQSGDTAASLTITSADINGGTIDGTSVGASTASTGAFTTLSASSTATLNTLSSSGATITGGSINGTTVGATTASTGAFTTLSATGVATVSAGSVSAPAITTSGDTNTGIYFPAADTIAFTEGGTESMRITSAGNVGIGTSSPTAFNGSGLQISRTGANSTLTLTRTDGTSSDIRSGNAALTFSVDPQNAVADSFLQFSVDNTERMRVDSSGNLLVGKTSTSNSSIGFYVAGSGSADHGMVNVARPPNTTMIQIVNSTAGTIVGSISQNGTNTTYSTSSDYRLKENILPMTNALAKVAQLKPVTYTWKSTGEADEGFIAHELQEVCPSAVSGEKDATRIEQYEISPAIPATYDEEGNELTSAIEAVMGEREVPSYQGIDTSFLVATLTAAIQELKAIVDAQAERITALENK